MSQKIDNGSVRWSDPDEHNKRLMEFLHDLQNIMYAPCGCWKSKRTGETFIFCHKHLVEEEVTAQLRNDEAIYINENQERCSACGHLKIFHNDDYEICKLCDCDPVKHIAIEAQKDYARRGKNQYGV